MKAVRQVSVILAAAGLCFFSVYGQGYPFSDDFSNPLQTNSNWAKWRVGDGQVSATCNSVVYTIVNSHTDGYPGLIYHHYTVPTSVFTASCVITRSSDTIGAGMWLCLPAYQHFDGYLVTLEASGSNCINSVIIRRFVAGSGPVVMQEEFHQQSPSNPSDTLQVSCNNGTFHVSCNGVYLGSYTDGSPLAAGDFALYVPQNTTALFDDVLFTDQFTAGSFPVVFRDNFNNGNIEKQWLVTNCSYFIEHDSVLDITVPAPALDFNYAGVSMAIDTFYSTLIVSHRSGDSNSLYGIYLRGPDSVSGPNLFWRTASFGITGLGLCAAYVPGTISYKYPPQGYIHGKAFVSALNDTLFYWDTIVVRRTSGSSLYVMYVNGHLLDTLTTAEITFPVVGAGIYAGGGQNIFADYFAVGLDSSVAGVINIAKNIHYVKGLKFSPLTSRYLFNPLGRIVGRKDASGRLNARFVAPGFYITDEKRSGIIINKQER